MNLQFFFCLFVIASYLKRRVEIRQRIVSRSPLQSSGEIFLSTAYPPSIVCMFGFCPIPIFDMNDHLHISSVQKTKSQLLEKKA